jgi:hypothetical protein
MGTIIISKTAVVSNGKVVEVKRLRVCDRVDAKKNAISSAWRDAKENLLFDDAVKQMLEQGFTVEQDFWRVTTYGNGKAHRTHIVRFNKAALAQTESVEDVPAPVAPEAPAAPTRKPRKPRKGTNSEQLERQLEEQHS